MSPEQFQQHLISWSERYGRKCLPWQQEVTPYRVWVSEVMLQQTQVATVMPYFHRFMTQFPDVQSLAHATLDSVLHCWSGLGYYARARNLHRTARLIADYGCFPDTVERLCELPGIGRSTAGAIVSIAFQRPAAILDGNVKRVLARYYGVEGWPGDSRISGELWRLSERLSPTHRTAEYTQAIMDLGATLCTRQQPVCPQCPLQMSCDANLNQSTDKIPASRPSKTLVVRACFMLLLSNRSGRYYLEKRPATGIWGGLWGLPEFNGTEDLIDWCEARNVSRVSLQWRKPLRHTFTHFHLDYTPVIAHGQNPIEAIMEDSQVIWYHPNAKNQTCGMPAPVKRLLEKLSA